MARKKAYLDLNFPTIPPGLVSARGSPGTHSFKPPRLFRVIATAFVPLRVVIVYLSYYYVYVLRRLLLTTARAFRVHYGPHWACHRELQID
jgi:hypothetical protein